MRKSRAKRSLGDIYFPPASELPGATEAELYQLGIQRVEALSEDPTCPPHIFVQLAKLIAAWRNNKEISAPELPTLQELKREFGLTDEELELVLEEIRAETGATSRPSSEPSLASDAESISEAHLYDLTLRRLRWLLENPETPPHLILQALKIVLPWKGSLPGGAGNDMALPLFMWRAKGGHVPPKAPEPAPDSPVPDYDGFMQRVKGPQGNGDLAPDQRAELQDELERMRETLDQLHDE